MYGRKPAFTQTIARILAVPCKNYVDGGVTVEPIFPAADKARKWDHGHQATCILYQVKPCTGISTRAWRWLTLAHKIGRMEPDTRSDWHND